MTSRLGSFVAGARAAFSFFSILPVGKRLIPDAAFRWATAWFPVVGLLVGVCGALVYTLAARGASSSFFVAATLAVITTAVVTGALHEDGLADTADALGGATSRERIFEILRDSRLGTYGVLALVFITALKIGVLAQLGARAPLAIIVAHVLARVSPVWLIAFMPYVSDGAAKSKPVVHADTISVGVATAFAASVAIALLSFGRLEALSLVEACAALVVLALIATRIFQTRAGGLTGDFLGALEQLGEVVVLFAIKYTVDP